ncbi:hypothetical protein JAAARDRAFT_81304 [Jaapia argillacea MUCL 33604]|uniref:Uncharacterized protein n=1 Tax=Jaapia argillacea MUCL 33604 TaxID=933084 RepID=A0A067PA06_9AGAM|nr:hypothetical protein JAAARDRAFT_81304 [Jaapia argillacea MUCL 33604]
MAGFRPKLSVVNGGEAPSEVGSERDGECREQVQEIRTSKSCPALVRRWDKRHFGKLRITTSLASTTTELAHLIFNPSDLKDLDIMENDRGDPDQQRPPTPAVHHDAATGPGEREPDQLGSGQSPPSEQLAGQEAVLQMRLPGSVRAEALDMSSVASTPFHHLFLLESSFSK